MPIRCLPMTDRTEIDQETIDRAVAAETTRIMRGLYPEVITTGGPGRPCSGEAMFQPQPEHAGAPGWMQGGLSATVLDFFCARLAGASLSMGVATATLDLRYRQPVLIDGGPYRISGSTEQPRSKSVHVRGAILSADGHPLVEADALFVGVRPQRTPPIWATPTEGS